MNYVFYVCDSMPQSGHFRKMDAEYEIATHIKNGLKNCIVKKYTEYEGNIIDAQSVGVVFPTYSWGASLSVYSFLQNLRVSENTHLYAVVLGEKMTFSSGDYTTVKNKIIDRVNNMRLRHGLIGLSDIYLRSNECTRVTKSLEELVRGQNNIKTYIKYIMESLLLHNIDSLDENAIQNKKSERFIEPVKLASDHKVRQEKKKEPLKLSNVFLDDSMFEGVKLCQVM